VKDLRDDERRAGIATIGDNLPDFGDNRATLVPYNGSQEAAWFEQSPSLSVAARLRLFQFGDFTMKKLTIGLSMAALAIAGTAYAGPGRGGDGDTNRTLTRAEAQTHATEMFARMDANKDGKLDAADREARRTAMFDRIDSNKDGQISRAEFFANQRPERAEGGQRPEGADGKQRGHRGGKGRGGNGHHMMRSADANGDKAVTQAEFTASAMQRFENADANKDGQVTSEERQAARSAMRDQKRPGRAPAAPAQPGN